MVTIVTFLVKIKHLVEIVVWYVRVKTRVFVIQPMANVTVLMAGLVTTVKYRVLVVAMVKAAQSYVNTLKIQLVIRSLEITHVIQA